MFQQSKLSAALVLAFGGLAIVPGATFAQSGGNALQRVEVVGSNIARTSTEGPSPVVIMKREEIAKTGATNVNDLLKNMGVILGGFDDQNNNSSAPSTSAASLRGVGADSTLVLLNGRRLAPHGLAQATEGGDVTFVDLNTLPLAAIEQIQVLKDGASAIYGSDAIAGVINVITKKNYQGFEARATIGNTTAGGGAERGATITGGMGDIEKDGWNILATVDTLHRDSISSYKMRELTKTADLRPFGGADRRSAGSPYMNFFDDLGNAYTPACPTANLRGGLCRWEPADQEGLQPESDRASLFSIFNAKIGKDLNFFGEALFTKNVAKFTQRSAFLDFGAAGGDASQQAADYRGYTPAQAAALKTQMSDLFLAQFQAAYPGVIDPAATALFPFGRATEMGPRSNEMVSTSTRYIGGLNGSINGFDWQTAVGQSTNTARLSNGQEINADKFVDDILAGRTNVISLPKTGFGGSQFSSWRESNYKVTFVDGKVTGEIAQLPAGPLGVAVGAEWRKEELKDASDPFTSANLALGTGAQDASGDRTAFAAYGELNIPVIKDMEAQLALRSDRYSDFGSTTNPKIALRYQPAKSLVMRGSYATSFRAPSLFQLFKSVKSDDFQELIDTPRCAVTGAALDCDPILRGTRADGASLTGGLKPEQGKSTNFGFVFEPAKGASIGIDVWHINKTDAIQTSDAQEILDKNLTNFIVRFPSTVPGVPGSIQRVITGYRNIGSLDVRGFDIDGSFGFDLTSRDKVTLSGSVTMLDRYAKDGVDYVGTWTAGAAIPKTRAQAKVNWVRGDYSTTFMANFLGSYKDDPSIGFDRDLAAYTTYDLQLGYTGFKNVDVRVGARNLFDTAPPLSLSSYVPFDQGNTSAKGRFVYATVGYVFK